MCITIMSPHRRMIGVANKTSGIPTGIEDGLNISAIKVGKLEAEEPPSAIRFPRILDVMQKCHLLQHSASSAKQQGQYLLLVHMFALNVGQKVVYSLNSFFRGVFW